MSGSAASIAYLVVAVFLGGTVLGIVAMVAIAVRREDKRYSLQAPDTPGFRAALTLREIIKKPGQTSIISRTPRGTLVVDSNEPHGNEGSAS